MSLAIARLFSFPYAWKRVGKLMIWRMFWLFSSFKFCYVYPTDSAEMVGMLRNHANQMRSVHIHMDASLMNFSTKSKILNYFSWTKIALFLNLLLLIWSFSQTLQISGRYFRILLWRTTLLIWWRLFRWTMHSQVIFLTASFDLAVLKL